MIKAIFFDAAGTLFFLTKTVGDHYAYVGREVGLDLDAQELDRAFHTAWKEMPRRSAIDGPRENDDKGWWRELVDLILDQVAAFAGRIRSGQFFRNRLRTFCRSRCLGALPGSSRRVGETAAAVPTRGSFKFRRAFALHSRTPRYLEIFYERFRLQRARSRQT